MCLFRWGLVNNQRFSYTDSHLSRMIQLIDSFTMNPMIGLLVGHLSSEDVPTCAGGHPLPQVASPVQLDVSPHPGEHGRVQGEDARTGQGRQRLLLRGRGADGDTRCSLMCPGARLHRPVPWRGAGQRALHRGTAGRHPHRLLHWRQRHNE